MVLLLEPETVIRPFGSSLGQAWFGKPQTYQVFRGGSDASRLHAICESVPSLGVSGTYRAQRFCKQQKCLRINAPDLLGRLQLQALTKPSVAPMFLRMCRRRRRRRHRRSRRRGRRRPPPPPPPPPLRRHCCPFNPIARFVHLQCPIDGCLLP